MRCINSLALLNWRLWLCFVPVVFMDYNNRNTLGLRLFFYVDTNLLL